MEVYRLEVIVYDFEFVFGLWDLNLFVWIYNLSF